jgi:Tol biopolymer transport system component
MRVRALVTLIAVAVAWGSLVASAQAAEIMVFDKWVNHHSEIWKANADGSNAQRIPHPVTSYSAFPGCVYPGGWDWCNLYQPALSPDGTQVAFITLTGDVYVSDLIGGSLRAVVTTQKGYEGFGCTASFPGCALEKYFDPEWSPDGTRLVAEYNFVGSGTGPVLRTMDVSGSTPPRDLVDWGGWQLDPAFSRDGQRVVFATMRDPFGGSLSQKSIYSVSSLNGGDARRITNQTTPYYEHPVFDGSFTHLIVGEEDQDADGVTRDDLISMAADGSGARNITQSPGIRETHPDFSSDGNKILFSSYSAGEQRIEVINADGTGRRTLIGGFPAPGDFVKPSMGQGAYVEPTPQQAKGLLAQYAPQLRYSRFESYWADSAATITDNCVQNQTGGVIHTNYLKRSSGKSAAASCTQLKEDDLSLGYLGSTNYRSGDFLDEADPVLTDAQYMHGLPQYRNRIYGRFVRASSGDGILQYWLWSYYNPAGTLGVGVHEGDWEMVQFHLSSDNTPKFAAYAQHKVGEVCAWNLVERTADGHPVVYVGEGSHASYFRPGPDGSADDGAEFRVVPTVEDVTVRPAWLGWGGRWGGSGNSPDTPGFRGNATKWNQPEVWSTGPDLNGCTVSASASRRGHQRQARSGVPLPRVVARRQGDQIVTRYRFDRWPEAKAKRPGLLLTSIDTAGTRYTPLTVRTRARRQGVVRQPIGLGRAPLKFHVSVISRTGRRSIARLVRLDR